MKAQRDFYFPGENSGKRAARLFLYRHALQAPREGNAITLAGPDPRPEIELLRDYLHWSPQRTWFVDKDKRSAITKALHHVRKTWPQANTQQVDLKQVVNNLGCIGFANLDFMGFIAQKNMYPCLEAVVPKLLPKAVLGITWMRGREQNHHRWMRIIQAQRHQHECSLNDCRWRSVLDVMRELSDGELKFIGGIEYQNNHSPMAVSVFRRS